MCHTRFYYHCKHQEKNMSPVEGAVWGYALSNLIFMPAVLSLCPVFLNVGDDSPTDYVFCYNLL